MTPADAAGFTGAGLIRGMRKVWITIIHGIALLVLGLLLGISLLTVLGLVVVGVALALLGAAVRPRAVDARTTTGRASACLIEAEITKA